MPRQTHRIERLMLDVEVAGMAAALRLRARVEELSRGSFQEVLQRVLDGAVPDGLHVRLGRLDLDLGEIAADRLEQDAPALLERRLAEAVAGAVERARRAPGPGEGATSRDSAALEDLDVYLRQGTARFRSGAQAFDPGATLRRLIGERPEALTAMLRRRAGDRHALERLVLQSSEEDLGALLALLAPAEAAVILAYHADLQRLYLRSAAPAPTPALPRALWVLTLEFLLRDPGSQSNRRALLAYLLEGMAEAEGLTYPDLLALLGDMLEEAHRKHPLPTSLPGVLKELLARLPEVDPAPRDAGAAPAADEGDAAAAQAGGEGGVEALLILLQGAADAPAALEARVREVTPAVFTRLVERLEPNQAALIHTWLAQLAALHREEPLLAFSKAGLERHLRLHALRLLLRPAAGPFDRRRWLDHLLRALARGGGVSYPFLLESLHSAVAGSRGRLAQGAALPDSTAALAAELPPIAGADPYGGDGDKVSRLLSRLRRHADDPSALAALAHGLADADFRRLVERLQPRHASALLSDIADLQAAQRRRPLFALSPAGFDVQLRSLALRGLAADPESRFQRSAWLSGVLHGLADSAGLAYGHVLEMLTGNSSPLPPGSALRRPLAVLARQLGGDAGAATLPAGAGRNDAAPLDLRGMDVADLIPQLSDSAAAGRAELIGALAKDPALLLRVAAELEEASLAAALERFRPSRAAAVAADLDRLADRHAAEPLARLDAAAFRRLIWTLAVAALAGDGAAPSRDDLRRLILTGIARHEGVSPRELGDWRQLAEAPAPAALPAARGGPAPDPLALAESFLRTGRPPAAGAGLAEAARGAPSAFAALLRRLTAAASGNPGVLIDRLLEWMLPEEIVAVLLPSSVDEAAGWAAGLSDVAGTSMTAAWREVLGAVLAGNGIGVAAAPVSPGARYDRVAILRHWLDGGTLPWWTPPGIRIETLLAELPGRPVAALGAVFGDTDPERVAARLGRALGGMTPDSGLALLELIAPWAFAPAGPLAARSAGLAGEALEGLRIRAAAAALTGAPLHLEDLARPVPALPAVAPDPPVPRQREDRAALFVWLRGAGSAPARLLRHFADLADRGDAELDAVLRSGLARAETRMRWAAEMPAELLARIVHRMAPARARFILDLAMILAEACRQAAPSAAPRARERWAIVLGLAAEGDCADPRTLASRLIAGLTEAAPDKARDICEQAAQAARQSGQANLLAALRRTVAAAPPRRSGTAAKPRPERAAPPPAPEPGAVIYVRNAGLVLFNPFLALFFERLGVITEGPDGAPRIAGVAAASRAVHLLQFLADRHCDRPEPDLVLNKLLSGVPVAAPVARSIEPGPADEALCAELTDAVLGHWPALHGTSPAGLRETFLQREGRLRREDGRWALEVQRKTVDVLVDQVPWSMAVVYHRWMAEPLHVAW
jgi:hypothetical protein